MNYKIKRPKCSNSKDQMIKIMEKQRKFIKKCERRFLIKKIISSDDNPIKLKFKDKINNSKEPFIPIIKEKPNAIEPLKIYKTSENSYCHPYQTEIEMFKPSETLMIPSKITLPRSLKQTPFKFINKKEDLEKLVHKLKNVEEFAVDLEHHSYRSFQGFTCLMQISTRKEDFVMDAIEIREEMYILNEVFTNPSIVKVFHDSQCDILWLQRDFGIYVVNLFDTSQASKLLKSTFTKHGLSNLVKHYCNVELQKKYQLADWRIRPLSKDMINYSREDTHYLLAVYDGIKNDLIKANLCKNIFESGKKASLMRYERPQFKEKEYIAISKSMKFEPIQTHVLKELFYWRDNIARIEDESLHYVLPKSALIRISKNLPLNNKELLKCHETASPLFMKKLNEIVSLILNSYDRMSKLNE